MSSITSSQLIFYGSANLSNGNTEKDGQTGGGAIDLTCQVIFDNSALANTLADQIDFAAASTTGITATVTGRKVDGSIASEVVTLNGTTHVQTVGTYQNILKVVFSNSTHPTITAKSYVGNTVIFTSITGIGTVRRPFYDVASDVAGTGSTRTYYEKIFVKNTNGGTTLTNAVISKTGDTGGNITFALASAIDDTVTSTNRQTAPSGGLTFDNSAKNLPSPQTLPFGSAIGVWLLLTLTAGLAAASTNTCTLQIAGTTT